MPTGACDIYARSSSRQNELAMLRVKYPSKAKWELERIAAKRRRNRYGK